MEAKAKLASNGIASVDWNALTNDSAGAKTKRKDNGKLLFNSEKIKVVLYF